jgi:hypothetical protein
MWDRAHQLHMQFGAISLMRPLQLHVKMVLNTRWLPPSHTMMCSAHTPGRSSGQECRLCNSSWPLPVPGASPCWACENLHAIDAVLTVLAGSPVQCDPVVPAHAVLQRSAPKHHSAMSQVAMDPCKTDTQRTCWPPDNASGRCAGRAWPASPFVHERGRLTEGRHCAPAVMKH